MEDPIELCPTILLLMMRIIVEALRNVFRKLFRVRFGDFLTFTGLQLVVLGFDRKILGLERPVVLLHIELLLFTYSQNDLFLHMVAAEKSVIKISCPPAYREAA